MPELREIDAETFPLVHDLIGGWFGLSDRELVGLLDPPWADADAPRGWVLVDGGRAVGFLGAVVVDRPIDGKEYRFCNLTTWYVDPDHRGSSLAMFRPLLRMRDLVITDFSPSIDAQRISERLGFETIDAASRLFEPGTGRSASLDVRPGDLGRLGLLGPAERRIVRDHQWIPTCRWYVATADDEVCLVVATRSTSHRRPYVRIDHVSNSALFVEHADAIVTAIRRGEQIDTVFAGDRFGWSQGARCGRLLPDRTVSLVLHAHGLAPEQIDTLYSEVMLLDITTLPHSLPSTHAHRARHARDLALWRMRQAKQAGARVLARRTT